MSHVNAPWTQVCNAMAILVGTGVALAGVRGVFWYRSLHPVHQQEADRLAAHYAKTAFGKACSYLASHEASYVYDRVKAHFTDN